MAHHHKSAYPEHLTNERCFVSKVLVADDDEALRSVISEALEEDGHAILQAANGVQALKVLEDNSGVALLLSDVRMPNMDGYELAERALAKLPELKVLMLTGYPAEQLPPSILRAREARVLRKPVEIKKLRDLIASMLARP
jgi:two-component system cell cycle response regulator CpdR